MPLLSEIKQSNKMPCLASTTRAKCEGGLVLRIEYKTSAIVKTQSEHHKFMPILPGFQLCW